jgi:hypothetical protein
VALARLPGGDRVRVATVEWFFTCLLVLVTAVLLGFSGDTVYRRCPTTR